MNVTEIGLISNVSKVLDSYLGFSEPTLAEYIIHLASQSKSANDLSRELAENGAELPLEVVENLMRMVGM